MCPTQCASLYIPQPHPWTVRPVNRGGWAALRRIENMQGFCIDERDFVASNPAHIIGSWDFKTPLVSKFFMCGCFGTGLRAR